MDLIDPLCNAIEKELITRKNEQNEPLETIYFGGGTPSVLSHQHIYSILNTITANYNLADQMEITFEANPDDLNRDYLKTLKENRINRLSIGIQSFFESDLIWMNRSHNAQQAIQCILDAQDVGISNISIDLIFGLPNARTNQWQQNLKKAYGLNVQHLSCYGLTVEPKTALEKMIQLGKKQQVKEAQQLEEFNATISILESYGYEHYEISNYCLEGFESKHNSNYWLGRPYIGVGPSAHSYSHPVRRWNINHNLKYVQNIENNELYFEEEHLSKTEQYNEYILTRLRTKWGCSLEDIKAIGTSYLQHFLKTIQSKAYQNCFIREDDLFFLSNKGKALADHITSDLFLIDEI